ncbi:MAG: hypothetical protein Q7T82_15510 [Armatimonadota bacterium]|nr:hypothetical protein [Armatimonadota bacterium]
MAQTVQQQPGLGSGIYTHAEAARLLRVSTAKARNWAEGYTYQIDGRERTKAPVLQRRAGQPGLLTFHDLIELFFVREFRNAGVSLQDIRGAAKLLSEKWDTPYPFACRKLDTDGVQILMAAGEHYENVARQQNVFRFAEDFFKNIDFSDDCLAEKWWPMGRDKLVVIDPHRSFGTPIDLKSGVRTEILYAAYQAEDRDVEAVANWYEIPPEQVKAAVEFEETWLKAA